jgi:cysteine-rich repeat protein
MTGMSTPTTGETETTGPVDPTETDPSTSTSEPPAECGNGNVEGDEQCDDGNQEPGDGCEPECVFTPECGNGEVEQGELCDDGNQVDDDECSNACQINEVAECGDGVTQRGEDCDDGNLEDGDGCQADCTITPPDCGNGVVEPGEDCDDGNNTNGGPGDFCKNDCTVFVPANCSAPAEYVICDDMLNLQNKQDKTQAHKAMGICNDTPANSVQITDWSFMATDNASWQIARGFGTYSFDHDGDPNTPNQLIYSPREGSTFLMISTGAITAPNNQGIVVQPPASQEAVGTNNNPDAPDTMPAPLTEAFGSNGGNGGTPFIGCDGVGDCSDTLFEQWDIGFGDPNDKLWFTFKTTVPPGTFGYTFDFVYCSAEWPQWVGDPYNDLLVAWQTDPTPDDPNADPPVDAYTGNVTFIPNPNDPAEGLPLTVTALDPYLGSTGFSDNEPQLAGTGFEGNACSDWFTAKGGVQPGAEVTIGFFIADMTDTIWTTTALIDNFRWDCEGCVPSEVDDCGVQDPQ